MTMTDKIFAALTVIPNLKRCAKTIAIDVFGPKYDESDMRALKRELECLVRKGRLAKDVRFQSHAIRNNRFGGSATGRHKAAFYSVHVEPGISVQHVCTVRVR